MYTFELYRVFTQTVDDLWDLLTSETGASRWISASSAITPQVQVQIDGYGDDHLRVIAVQETRSITLITRGCLAVLYFERRGSPEQQQSALRVRVVGRSEAVESLHKRGWNLAIDRAKMLATQVERRRTPRQAVIVIHGIGEQVQGISGEEVARAIFGGSPDSFYSKPDDLSESFDAIRYQGRKLRDLDRPTTDVYECYWADQLRDNRTRHMLAWALSLLFRKQTPTWARLLAASSITIGVVALVLVGLIVTGRVVPVWIIPPLVVVLGYLYLGGVVNVVGDAARYMHRHPDNVASRDGIRKRAVDLLDAIHRNGKYHRVIVVGHSLGSVIALDALSHYWHRVHRSRVFVIEEECNALEEAERSSSGGSFSVDHQRRLWRELRTNGSPWLVTDLVTMGSPLTHFAWLVGGRNAGGATRYDGVARCPPEPEIQGGQARFSYSDRFISPSGLRIRRLINRRSVFAATCWTNIYARGERLWQRDLVGGPLSSILGEGIRDIQVDNSSGGRISPVTAHTSYWRCAREDGATSRVAKPVGVDGWDTYLGELARRLPIASYATRSWVDDAAEGRSSPVT